MAETAFYNYFIDGSKRLYIRGQPRAGTYLSQPKERATTQRLVMGIGPKQLQLRRGDLGQYRGCA